MPLEVLVAVLLDNWELGSGNRKFIREDRIIFQ